MNRNLKLLTNRYIVLIVVIALSFWFWKTVKADFFISMVVIFQSLLLLKFVSDQKFSSKLAVLLFTVLLFTGIFLIRNNLDNSLWVLNPTERVRFDRRHYYFAEELGKLYMNKFSLYYYTNLSTFLYKYQRNVFYNLDPNLYFFASHPRERSGIDSFEKYSPLFLPFFILGTIWLFSNKSWKMFGYLSLVTVISGFISLNYKLGPILFAPVVNVLIVLGLVTALKYAFKNIYE